MCGVHVLYVSMWRPEVGLRGLPPLLSNFLTEVGFSQLHPELDHMDVLTGQLTPGIN